MSDTTVILHNPRCSKSRQALALLEEAGVSPTIVRYLDEPLAADALDTLCTQLGIEPDALIRWKDAAKLGITRDAASSRSGWLEILANHPALVERPVVVAQGRAVIGRPPERVLELLKR